MSCRRFQMLISQYVDRCLPPARAAMVERHLAECPECAALYREITQVVTTLKRLEPRRVSPGFTADLLARLRQREEPRWGWRGRWGPIWMPRWGYALAATVAAVMVLIGSLMVELRAPSEKDLPPELLAFVAESVRDYTMCAAAQPLSEAVLLLPADLQWE